MNKRRVDGVDGRLLSLGERLLRVSPSGFDSALAELERLALAAAMDDAATQAPANNLQPD